jgi:hypothetical protein
MPRTMVDRLGIGVGIVVLEEIRCRRVEFIENPSAGRHAGERVVGPDARESGRTRQAKYPGKEQSSIHGNLSVCRPVQAT